MIGGQYLDVTEADVDLADLHRLKTGRLFAAAVGLGLWAADVPPATQAPWRAFGEELGVLFQAVDDVIDGDGYAAELGEDGARDVAAAAARRAHERLEAIDADTSVLAELVDGLAVTDRVAVAKKRARRRARGARARREPRAGEGARDGGARPGLRQAGPAGRRRRAR